MIRIRLAYCSTLAAIVGSVPIACGTSEPLENSRGQNIIAEFHPQLNRLQTAGRVFVRPGEVGVRSAADPQDTTTALPGTVSVLAWLANPEEAIPNHTSLTVTVRTTDGDHETIKLESPPCSPAACSFEIGIRDRQHAYDLMPLLDAVPARFMRVTLGSDARAQIRVFTDDVNWARQSAMHWPGVRYSRVIDEPALEMQSLGIVPPNFSGALPIGFGPPVADDGMVQVNEGTTLTVEYRQPDGSTMTAGQV